MRILAVEDEPEVIRLSEDFCFSSRAASGMATTPCPGTIVNGHSPFRCSVPRNLRTSRVRRRTSWSSTLRRMITLSDTNSSTPNRETAPYSSSRSAVIIVVTPSPLSDRVSLSSSLRTVTSSGSCEKMLPIASRTSRRAPTRRTACSIRAISAPRS